MCFLHSAKQSVYRAVKEIGKRNIKIVYLSFVKLFPFAFSPFYNEVKSSTNIIFISFKKIKEALLSLFFF